MHFTIENCSSCAREWSYWSPQGQNVDKSSQIVARSCHNTATSSAQSQLTPICIWSVCMRAKTIREKRLRQGWGSVLQPSSYHFVTTNQHPLLGSCFFPICDMDMDDRLTSTHFRPLFESALRTYAKKTGIILAEHPFSLATPELQPRLRRIHYRLFGGPNTTV